MKESAAFFPRVSGMISLGLKPAVPLLLVGTDGIRERQSISKVVEH